MPPQHADATPRPPEDFSSVLATKEPVLLVGGQAVNLWALYYHEHTAGLEPFVSRDLDVLGTRETLETLAKLVGARPQFFPLRPPSNEIGVVIAKDRDGNAMLVEVLRYVNGVTNDELRETVYTVALGDAKVQLPSPIVLLQAKIANVIELDQTDRHDERHVRILARLMPAYLADLKQSAAEGRIEERGLIDALEQLLRVVTSATGKKAFARLEIGRRRLFDGLENDALPKVRAFVEKRLPRALPSQP
ncbi:MAG: hypothetical protein ACREIA_15940 [Opitutaceae bacterium]